MNGATADVWARIRSVPNRTIITRIGTSQNFFRLRKNDHISFKNDTILFPLKLMDHRRRIGTWRLTIEPVAMRFGFELQTQRILAAPTQN